MYVKLLFLRPSSCYLDLFSRIVLFRVKVQYIHKWAYGGGGGGGKGTVTPLFLT